MKTVCIQGLGFVGSAMSIAVAMAKDDKNKPLYEVIGIDLPNEQGKKRVQAINEGIFPFPTEDDFLLDSFKEVYKSGNLQATTNENEFQRADVIIVDINLDIPYLDNEPELQLDSLKNAIKSIGQTTSEDTLILIETTVPPGTCEKIIEPTLREELKKRKIDEETIHLAHSYERVMPGKNYLKSIIEYPRVFSGYTEKASKVCREFLESIIKVDQFPLTELESTTASETAKVLENTYRAVNIAFIDEWTKYAEAVGIDLFEVINAINVRDTHSNIRFPGLGVGGYCLTKDPTFTPAATKELFGLDLEFPFSKLAVKTNNAMPLHTIARLKAILDEEVEGKKILIFGITYRQDVGDTRYSASKILVNHLVQQGAKVTCHDPYLRFWEEMKLDVCNDYPDLSTYDAVVLAVGHSEYKIKGLDYWSKSKLLLDANMVLTSDDIKHLKNNNVQVTSVGRG